MDTKDKINQAKRQYEAVCPGTGSRENLSLHPIFNEKNENVGFIFLSREVTENIQEWQIGIQVHCKKPEKKSKIITLDKGLIN